MSGIVGVVLEHATPKIVDQVMVNLEGKSALLRWVRVDRETPPGECTVLVDTPQGIDVAFYQDCTDFFAFRPMSVESENFDEPDMQVTRWAYLPRKKR